MAAQQGIDGDASLREALRDDASFVAAEERRERTKKMGITGKSLDAEEVAVSISDTTQNWTGTSCQFLRAVLEPHTTDSKSSGRLDH